MYRVMSNEISNIESSNIPAWMRKASVGAKIGNIDSSDLKPPQLKMLAGMSPEVMNAIPGANPGNFWMTIFNQNLGHEVSGSLIILRKSYQVWAPKGGTDQKGPLASSTNGIRWDIPNQTFEVRLPNVTKPIKWKIGTLVTDFGVNKFGSQNPDDPNSKPIATRTYNMLWLIDMPNGQKQLSVLIAARTMTDPTQKFISATNTVGVDHYFQRYRLVQQKRTGPTGDPFFIWSYQFIGVEQEQAHAQHLRALYDQYVKSGFVTDLGEEAEEIHETQAAPPTAKDDEDDIPF